MYHKIILTSLLFSVSLVLFSQVTRQSIEKDSYKVNNAEPPHAYYQLDSGSVQVVPLDRIENNSYLFLFHYQPDRSGKQVYFRLAALKDPYRFIINGFTYGFGGEDGRGTEFNITPFLKKELNVIELLFDLPDGNLLAPPADPVMLLTRDPVHIRDFQIRNFSQPDSPSSIIRIHLFVKSYLTERNEGRSVVMRILNREGEPVGTQQQALDFPISFRQEVEVTFDQTIADPHRWSPNDPALYSLCLQMVEKGNLEGEMVSFKFGIRNATLADSLLVINQDTMVPKIAGIDFLDQYMEQSEQSLIDALEESGFNAVKYHPRLSSSLMDQFDRLGILVMKKEEDQDHATDRRDMNRPSIILTR